MGSEGVKNLVLGLAKAPGAGQSLEYSRNQYAGAQTRGSCHREARDPQRVFTSCQESWTVSQCQGTAITGL
jgi:hypothetical protein